MTKKKYLVDLLKTCGNNNNTEEKSASAKTITLKSNGSVHSAKLGIEEDLNNVLNEESTLPELSEVQKIHSFTEIVDKDLEEAATKIQAAFRGHQSRKSMKQPEHDKQGDISDELSLDDPGK
ncbi:hypothetical protein HHI36_020695 [Cryptolaemus montrouzieri]|uniref:Uncharacterized protein n=1 Tax=Cryptolaemus montrouzieri TaxID=559131 RepID=A0ABD2NBG7_9CUCU